MEKVDVYNINGCTLLHQKFTKELITDAVTICINDRKGYERTLCGSLSECCPSTIEIPDVDVNARFYVDSDTITVKPAGPFLYHVIVTEERKKDMDKKVALMQHHPKPIDVDIKTKKGKGIQKSYTVIKDTIYLWY